MLFLWNQSYDNEKDKTNVITLEHGKPPVTMKRALKVDGLDIFVRYSYSIGVLSKVFDLEHDTLDNYVSSRRPFGIDANIVKSSYFKKEESQNCVKCFW